MTSVYFAKPDQTYETHVSAVYAAWKQTIAAKRGLIERVGRRCDVSADDIVRASLLTVALHDVGKMIVPFQAMMQALQAGVSFNVQQNYRHELVSFLYVASVLQQSLRAPCIPLAFLGSMAVTGHHRRLTSDLDSFERERQAGPPEQLPDGIDEALKLAQALFRKEGYNLQFDRETVASLQGVDPYRKALSLVPHVYKFIAGEHELAQPRAQRERFERCRLLYAVLKGVLHYADWHGSGQAPVIYTLQADSESLVEHLRARCVKKGINFDGLTPFQSMCAEQTGNLILSAPTGSGKTEAALFWALRNLQEMGEGKVLYLLPTMVTANSIWERLGDVFGSEQVGLTHSTANLFKQATFSASEDEIDQWEHRKHVLFDQTFIKPATVATVDSLLTVGFNLGRWTVKEVNAANACVIVDEIHSYDGWTLGLIIATIRHFSRLGTRFLLMSATLPSRVRSLLLNELLDAKSYAEDMHSYGCRSAYYMRDAHLDEDLGTIAEALDAGHKVLVVVNTVRQCQALVREMTARGLDPLCYHAQFTLKDRKRIEEHIAGASLVVATQVVEVSLDIDFDWLFTECAPADALVQRAGRVNRYRDPGRDSRVFVYRSWPISERVYDPISTTSLLEATYTAFMEAIVRYGHELTDAHLLTLVEDVYRDHALDKSIDYVEALREYETIQTRRAGIYDTRFKDEEEAVTRRADYETRSIIPLCFREEALECPPSERRWYEVKLPLWYVQKHRRESAGITFCDVPYDRTLGALLRED